MWMADYKSMDVMISQYKSMIITSVFGRNSGWYHKFKFSKKYYTK